MAISLFGIADTNVASDAAIKASKIVNPRTFTYYQATGTAVVAGNASGPIIRGATATLVGFHAAITGAIATGADRTVDVDLHKSTGGGAFATVLSAAIQFTNGSTLYVDSTATISNASLVDGDLLKVVVTVAGAAGNQAQGLSVCCFYSEDYA